LNVALLLMMKYKDHPKALANGTIFPYVSNQDVKRNLKIIGEICGIQKYMFFDLTKRADCKDRLLTDLMFSDQLGFISIFENKLPKSERVFVAEQVSINIPVVDTNFSNHIDSINKIKRCIQKYLLKIKQDSVSAKSLKYEIDDLTSSFTFTNFISYEVYVLQYETYGKTERQVAFTYIP
jgi:hypothetical protein